MAESSTLGTTRATDNSNSTGNSTINENSHQTLEALRQQLEYYFSAQNLAKDTFLQTALLQSANHFCNVDTLSRFSNVVRICEAFQVDTASTTTSVMDLLVEAAQMSEYLVVHRDYNHAKDENATLLGIGPKVILAPVPRNTIILREVEASTNEEDVRALFEASDKWSGGTCPVSIKYLKEDVGNNWFVTVNGSDEDIVSTMLSLRCMTLKDQPVKARLKTESAAAKAVYASPPSIQAPTRYGYNNQSNTNTRTFSDGKGQQQSRQGNNGASKFVNNKQYGSKQFNKQQNPKLQQPPKKIDRASPPPMGVSHFPVLSGKGSESSTNEVTTTEAVEYTPTAVIEEETVVRSTEVPKASVGGYAAALLKAAPPATPKPPSPKSETVQSQKNRASANVKKGNAVSGKKESNNTAQNQKAIADSNQATTSKTDDSSTSASSSESPIPVPPPTWGSKKSFADILKAKQEKEQHGVVNNQ